MFSWGNYLDAALLLEDAIPHQQDVAVKEGLARAAISRSYYALYNATRECFINRWSSVPRYPDTGSHESLVIALKNRSKQYVGTPNESKMKKAGEDLDRLRLMRTEADYTVGTKVTCNFISECRPARNLAIRARGKVVALFQNLPPI